MFKIRLNLSPEKEIGMWTQVALGLVAGVVSIGSLRLLWPWLSHAPFTSLLLPILIVHAFVGGAITGAVTTLMLDLYALQFSQEIGWPPYLLFVSTGLLVSLLVKNTKEKIRVLSRAEIREEESQRFKLAASAGRLGVWEWDLSNNTLVWDEQMFEFYGTTKETFSGTLKDWQKAVHHEDFLNAMHRAQESLKDKSGFSSEFRIVRPGGEVRNIQAQALIIRDSKGKATKMFGLNRDITEEKRNIQKLQELNAFLENALEQSQAAMEKAEEAMQAKARFLDVAAHELRTPVTAVSLMLQLAQRQLQNGQGLSILSLNKIKTQTDRLTRLVVDLLEVSKFDRGVLELKYEEADLTGLIQDCVSNFQIQFPSRPINVKAPQDPVRLRIDTVRIFEVISNLLDNAINYSSEDSPIEIQLEDQETKVRVSITDQGHGLSESAQKRLFSAFERVNHTPQNRCSGLGLGLYISKGIVELHGGTIGLTSQVGQGSTFFFILPRTAYLKKTGTES